MGINTITPNPDQHQIPSSITLNGLFLPSPLVSLYIVLILLSRLSPDLHSPSSIHFIHIVRCVASHLFARTFQSMLDCVLVCWALYTIFSSVSTLCANIVDHNPSVWCDAAAKSMCKRLSCREFVDGKGWYREKVNFRYNFERNEASPFFIKAAKYCVASG